MGWTDRSASGPRQDFRVQRRPDERPETNSADDDPLEGQRRALRFGLLALLVLSPLPFGAVNPLPVLTIQLVAAALGAFALSIAARDPEGLPRHARRLLIPAAFLLGVGLVQWIPLPPEWATWFGAQTAELRTQLSDILPGAATAWRPISLDPSATLDASLRLGAYILIGLTAAIAVRRRAHLIQVAVAVSAAAAFQALYGAAEYLSGHQHIFGYAKQYYLDNATGTFINRNHFAGYLAMALPLALGLAVQIASQNKRKARTLRERLVHLGEAAGFRVALGIVAAAAIWGGILLSYSRSGLAAGLLASVFVLFHTRSWKHHARTLAIVLVLPAVLLLWQEVRAPGERYFEANEMVSLAGRLPVWQASVGIVPDHPVLGTGLGTYEGAFALYRPPEVRKLWNHAHNDWLQSAIEGGVLAAGAVLALLTLALWRRGRDSHTLMVLAPVHAALLAIALQSALDFSLRIPANAVLCACIIGLTCLRERADDPSVVRLSGMSSRSSRSAPPRRWGLPRTDKPRGV